MQILKKRKRVFVEKRVVVNLKNPSFSALKVAMAD